MIDYRLYQSKRTDKNRGKFMARSVAHATLDIQELSKHMSAHNTPYSPGAIKGVITDMVACIKELLLDGKNVKIDDLAIFSVGLKSGAADSAEKFSVKEHIKGMRLNARATGNLAINKLKLESQIREHSQYSKPVTTTPTTKP